MVTYRLFELQELDLELERLANELAALDEQLADDAALVAARDTEDKCAEARLALEEERRRQERDIEERAARIAPLEEKLYGGSVRNAKDLTDLQHEIEVERGAKERREDTLLEVLVDFEEAVAVEEEARRGLTRVEAEWQARRDELLGTQARLTAEAETARSRRAGAKGGLDGMNLARYESLRQTKQGRAVARVVRATCQACRVALPLSDIQRARSGRDLTFCSSCGRILHIA